MTQSLTPILDSLLSAQAESEPARQALRRVPWERIPALMRSLGQELPPTEAAALESLTNDPDLDMVTLVCLARIILVQQASRCERNRHQPRMAKAALAVCRELVGLTGSALTLSDQASRFDQ